MKLVQHLLFLLICVFGQVQTVRFIPSPAYAGISSAFNKTTNTFYYHSGLLPDNTYLEGIQRVSYDSAHETWRYRPSQNLVYPLPRSFYCSFLYENRYFVFGGIGETAIFRDFWFYDISYDYWIKLEVPNPISRRYSFAYTTFFFEGFTYLAVSGGKSESYYDNLIDLYFYNITGNFWITQNGYKECFDKGLSGSRMEFYDNKLYLFSGKHVNRSELTYFDDLCVYQLLPGFQNNTWQLLDTRGLLFNSTRGGSCVHEGFIYVFFGFDIVNDVPSSINTIGRLNLSNIESGWEKIDIEGCSASETIRDSFGFYYVEGSVYINGGLQGSNFLNSLLRLDLDNSKSSATCTVLQEQKVWPLSSHGASMVYADGGFFLFGGKQKTVISSDLFFLNLTTFMWTKMVTYGDLPLPRYKHSAESEGKYIVISGGIGVGEVLLDDFYLFEIETKFWTKISPASEENPPPVYYNCLAVRFPKIYLIGGAEDTHITNSLWEYDVSSNLFKKLYSFKSTDTGFFGHSCSVEIGSHGETLVTAYFGAKSLIDVPTCSITQYDLSKHKITPKVKILNDPNFPCRCFSSDRLLDNNYLLISGGERYKQEFFNDVWIINRHTLETYKLNSMEESLYMSASSFFNNTLFLFSGFSTNGLSTNFPSSDFIIEINLLNLPVKIPDLQLRCGLGMQIINGICEFCPIGTFNPFTNTSQCIVCPRGTYSEQKGSDSIYQCIPCPFDTFSIIPGETCSKCPEDRTCYIGTSDDSLSESEIEEVHHFRHHKDQPELFEPENLFEFKTILWLVILGITFLFTLAFVVDFRFRIYISYWDAYKNMHREKICDTEGNLIKRPLTVVPSKLGGFATVITVLILVGVSIDSVVTFVKTNEQEKILMVPIDTLIHKEDFDSEILKVTLMMSSFRGKCSFSHLTFTHSDHIKIEDRSIEETNPLCKIYYKLKLKDVIETGDFIKFYFNDSMAYTSDINIRLKTHSSIPGKDSLVAQYVTSSSGQVFRGVDETQFYFSFLPAFYSEVTTFHEFTKVGYVISISDIPVKGTEIDPRELGMYSGLGINVNLERIELGITTFKFEKKELMDYLLKFMIDFPGTFVMLSFVLWFYEFFYKACRGKYSGRHILVKRAIERERNRRRNGYEEVEK